MTIKTTNYSGNQPNSAQEFSLRISEGVLDEIFEEQLDDLLEVSEIKPKKIKQSSRPFNPPSQRIIEEQVVPPKTKQLTPAPEVVLEQQQQQQLEEYQRQLDAQEQQIKAQQEQLDRLSELLLQSNSPERQRPLSPWDFRQSWQRFRQYVNSLRGSSAYQPRFSMQQIVISYLGSFLGIAALAYISVSTSYPLIAAPFGAAAVLVFAVPNSPLAQPRNLIIGNLIGGLSSLVMLNLFGSGPWVMALAVATAIQVMQLTKTLHPPGGAVALVGVMSNAKWEFLFTPVLTGSIVLLICTVMFNNLMPGRSYPEHWL
jgi:HPP family